VASELTGVSDIARRYAAALYDLAEEGKVLDAVAGDLAGLRDMLAESEDLRRLIAAPVFDRAAQARAMAVILERAGANELTGRFVGVVAQNRRLRQVPAIIDGFLRMLAARRGEVSVEVTSAHPLTEAQLTALTDALKRRVGDSIDMDHSVDPALIGGLVVRVGSRMIDSSLRTKLHKLQLAMKGVG